MSITAISEGDVDRDERHPKFPGVDMERYHPRAGLWSALLALPAWLAFLFNSMLGFFPALIFADGGIGSKFHFWLFLKDKFLGGSADPVWSEAGMMTSQEWFLLAIALPATFAALYCLRKRPEFGRIEHADASEERMDLEVARDMLSTAGSGDASTAAIIDSVIGEKSEVDSNVVRSALGEMGVIADAIAAAQPEPELEFESEPESEPDEADSWGVWDPSTDPEPEPEPEPEIEVEAEPESKPKPTIPLLTDISEFLSKAAGATVSTAKGVATKVVEVKDKVVEKVRPKPALKVMPVRPAGLPPMAEWDPYLEEWVMLGRPVRAAPEPEPEVALPEWTRQELVEEVAIEEMVADVPITPRRATPRIPELP